MTGDTRPILVALTGGRGMIGTQIQKVLEERGVPFRTLDVAPTPKDDPRHLVGSVLDGDTLEKLVDGASALVHLARTTHDLKDMCRFDYPAMAPIMGAIVAHDIEIHFPSSQLVHDRTRDYPVRPVDEDHPLEPYSPYGAMKIAWERLLVSYRKTHGTRHITYRFPNVIPPVVRAGSGVARYIPCAIDDGVIKPTSDTERFSGESLIHAEQVAQTIVSNLGNQDAYGREYNLCWDEYMTYHALAEFTADILREHGYAVRVDWDRTGVPGDDFWARLAFSNARARKYLGFTDDQGALLRKKLARAVETYRPQASCS